MLGQRSGLNLLPQGVFVPIMTVLVCYSVKKNPIEFQGHKSNVKIADVNCKKTIVYTVLHAIFHMILIISLRN